VVVEREREREKEATGDSKGAQAKGSMEAQVRFVRSVSHNCFEGFLDFLTNI